MSAGFFFAAMSDGTSTAGLPIAANRGGKAKPGYQR